MAGKITPGKTKTYKPEIMTCPFCGHKLAYKYTVSNKVIQFTSGHYIRVKNLGYACPSCEHSDKVYFSQTANKFCVKGYTYSAKIIAMIYYYKEANYSRDQICDLLWGIGIEISDRNVDMIYQKYKLNFDIDYEANIISHYEAMMKEYKEVRLSIDHISVEDTMFLSVKDFFTGEQIGLHQFKGLNDPVFLSLVEKYLDHKYPITYIVTVRPIFEFYTILQKYAKKDTKFIAYYKY